MSALAKLAIGHDTGTSRPASAQQLNRLPQQKQGQQDEVQQLLRNQQQDFFWQSLQLAQQQQATEAACACRPMQQGMQQLLQQGKQQARSRTPAPGSAALAVTPHVTRPYRSMAALHNILQPKPCTEHWGHSSGGSSSSRPATAAAGASAHHISVSRPASAGISCMRPPRIAGALAPSSMLRPGSAAAAKLLRVIDKACGAMPGTTAGAAVAAAQRPCSTQSAHIHAGSTTGMPAFSSRTCTAAAAAGGASGSVTDSVVSCDSAACGMPQPSTVQPNGIAPTDDQEALMDAVDSRPTTAAVQCVLASAVVPGDGVNDRLLAIREKNSTFDESADLDIVHTEAEAPDECTHASAACSEAVAIAAVTTPRGGADATGQQAAAMVLSLESLGQSTLEVLLLELERLDVGQLEVLKQHIVGCAEAAGCPA